MKIFGLVLIIVAEIYNISATFIAWYETTKWYWSGPVAGISLAFLVIGINLMMESILNDPL